MGLTTNGQVAGSAGQSQILPGDVVRGWETGSSGGLAWDTLRQCLVLLSCRHVFGTQGEQLYSAFEIPVGSVARTAFDVDGETYDAAIADPGKGKKFELTHPLAAVIYEIDRSGTEQDVTFMNQTFEYRRARWIATPLSGQVPGSTSKVAFSSFYELEDADDKPGLAKQGDSGAILFEATDAIQPARSVGMLFAGFDNTKKWYAFRLKDVFEVLKLESLAEAPFRAFLGSVGNDMTPGGEPFDFLIAGRQDGSPKQYDFGDDVAQRLTQLFGADAVALAHELKPVHRIALLERLLNDDGFRSRLWYVLRGIMQSRADKQQAANARAALRDTLQAYAQHDFDALSRSLDDATRTVDALYTSWAPPFQSSSVRTATQHPIKKK